MKSQRFVAIADNHGDQIDPVCEAALFRWLPLWKPDIVIHAGDNFNFAPIRKKASEAERAESMTSDLAAGLSFLKRLYSYGSIRVFLRGNHDERLWDLAEEGSGLLQDHAVNTVRDITALCHRLHIKMLPYDVNEGVWDQGDLRVIHGYAAGKNAGTRHAQAYGNCIYGHTHTQCVTAVEDHNGPSVALGIGCLLKIKQRYARANLGRLRHQNGWVYGLCFEDGTYQLLQTKRIGDKFYAAENIKAI